MMGTRTKTPPVLPRLRQRVRVTAQGNSLLGREFTVLSVKRSKSGHYVEVWDEYGSHQAWIVPVEAIEILEDQS